MKADEKRTRNLLNIRSNGLCERCGRQGHTVHHRRKRSSGGPWSASNCVFLCGHGTVGCHSWCEFNPNAASEKGFHVRSWENEKQIPVLILGEWVLLQDDGSKTPHVFRAENQDDNMDSGK